MTLLVGDDVVLNPAVLTKSVPKLLSVGPDKVTVIPLFKSVNINASTTITGSLSVSGSTVKIGNNTLTGTNTISGSNIISGSNTIIGNTVISGSQIMSGSNTIIGNTIISGSITISGSATNNIIGTTTITGSLRLNSNGTGTGLFINGQKQFNYIALSHTASILPTQNVSGSFIYSTTEHSSSISVVSGSRITFANRYSPTSS